MSSSLLETLSKDVLSALPKLDPVEATSLGLHEADHRLPDPSVESSQEYAKALRGFLAQADRIPRESLSRAEKIDLDLLISIFKCKLYDIEEQKMFERNPTYYTGLLTHSVFILLLRDFAPMEERLAAVCSRLEQMPLFLAAAMRRLNQPPSLWVQIALEDVEGAMEFFHSTFPVLAEQYPKVRHRLLSASLKAVRAISSFSEFLERDLLQRSTSSFAAGKEAFEFYLRQRHMIPDSLEELVAFGRDELSAAQQEMDRIAHEAGEGSWVDMLNRIQLHHPSSGELLKAYEEALTRVRTFVEHRELASLPLDEELEIIETPVFLRHLVPFAAYYPPAPFEDKQKGYFLVTPPPEDETRELRLRGHNYAFINLTTVHESFPGHHLQLTVSNRSGTDLRRLGDNSMFAEGWALYCEEMMYEVGYYDRKSRLLQLKDLAWRACRVIIDVGLHTGSMSFDEAVQMMVQEAKIDQNSAIAEVKWYSLQPTYPLSYLRGKREILRMRDRWRQQGAFSPKAFHDALLEAGTIPMALADRHLFA